MLLNDRDPISNFTWIQEITERNKRVADHLTTALSNLKNFVEQQSSKSIDTNIKDEVNDLNSLLAEALSVRVSKDVLNNSTNQTLVLANIINDVFYSYGRALGIPQDKLSTMAATMNMSSMSSMQDMNLQNDMSNMSNMNGISSHSDNTIVNQTE